LTKCCTWVMYSWWQASLVKKASLLPPPAHQLTYCARAAVIIAVPGAAASHNMREVPRMRPCPRASADSQAGARVLSTPRKTRLQAPRAPGGMLRRAAPRAPAGLSRWASSSRSAQRSRACLPLRPRSARNRVPEHLLVVLPCARAVERACGRHAHTMPCPGCGAGAPTRMQRVRHEPGVKAQGAGGQSRQPAGGAAPGLGCRGAPSPMLTSAKPNILLRTSRSWSAAGCVAHDNMLHTRVWQAGR